MKTLWNEQGGRCALTGIVFDLERGKGIDKAPFGPSVDRKGRLAAAVLQAELTAATSPEFTPDSTAGAGLWHDYLTGAAPRHGAVLGPV